MTAPAYGVLLRRLGCIPRKGGRDQPTNAATVRRERPANYDLRGGNCDENARFHRRGVTRQDTRTLPCGRDPGPSRSGAPTSLLGLLRSLLSQLRRRRRVGLGGVPTALRFHLQAQRSRDVMDIRHRRPGMAPNRHAADIAISQTFSLRPLRGRAGVRLRPLPGNKQGQQRSSGRRSNCSSPNYDLCSCCSDIGCYSCARFGSSGPLLCGWS